MKRRMEFLELLEQEARRQARRAEQKERVRRNALEDLVKRSRETALRGADLDRRRLTPEHE